MNLAYVGWTQVDDYDKETGAFIARPDLVAGIRELRSEPPASSVLLLSGHSVTVRGDARALTQDLVNILSKLAQQSKPSILVPTNGAHIRP